MNASTDRSMRLVYFDEVKADSGKQQYYWLGGIAVEPADIRPIESEVNALAESVFGSSLPTRETEFHATEIYNRRGVFEKLPDGKASLELLQQLIRIVDQHPVIRKVYARLEPARMVVSDIDAMAFTFFVERTDMLLEKCQSVGMLIGDFDSHAVSFASAIALSSFRKAGTPYRYGRDITRLIDTVHFTHSHVSRMLQLADVYVWCLQLCGTTPLGATGMRGALATFIRSETQLLWADNFKEFPGPDSWIQQNENS